MSGDAAITTITKTTVATTTTTTTRTTTTNTDDFYANATSKCCCCFTFLLLLLLLSSGVWGPARPLLLQQNNKCGSATRAVACPCPCSVCVWRNENWIRLLPPSSLSPLFLCSSSAVRFSLVWLVYCGRLAGGVGQAGDTMEPLSRCLPLSLSFLHTNYGFCQTWSWLLFRLPLVVVVVVVGVAGVSAWSRWL